MKKIFVRIAGSLCVVAVLIMFFFTTWVQIEGVKARDMRNFRKQLTGQLEDIQDRLTSALQYEHIKDDLRDNDLPRTKTGIKNRIGETKDILKELIDDKVSFGELFLVATKGPGYIAETERLLESTYCTDVIFYEGIDVVEMETVQQIADEAEQYVGVFYLVTIGLVIFVLLGCASVVVNIFGKLNVLKYVFLIIAVVVIFAVSIGIPYLSSFIQNELPLPSEIMDISLGVTAAPYITLFFVVAIIALDIVAIVQKKKKEEE